MKIINCEDFTSTTFAATLAHGKGTHFSGDTWLDDRGLEFLPDRLEITWIRKASLQELVVAAIGGDGVLRSGKLARVRRWRRWADGTIDSAPEWIQQAAAAGPGDVYEALLRGV